MKAFWVTDEEIYAANTAEEARDAFMSDTGCRDTDCPLDEVVEVTDAELDKEIPDCDEGEQPTGAMTTMRAWLNEKTEPGYLCGTVY